MRKVRVERNRLYVRLIKAISQCVDCGSKENLTFDHLPGSLKRGTIANLIYRISINSLKAEIAKCELVCRTCHDVRELARREEGWLGNLRPLNKTGRRKY